MNSESFGRSRTTRMTAAALILIHATIAGGNCSNRPTARAAPAYRDAPEATMTPGAAHREAFEELTS